MFQFTPVMRRATLRHLRRPRVFPVSIHARHVTGDQNQPKGKEKTRCFNSRPSCDGRPSSSRRCSCRRGFNSRPSCDGRPAHLASSPLDGVFQFTPVVRRATLHGVRRVAGLYVSIHARRATGDGKRILYQKTVTAFQFTPVMRRATGRWARRRVREGFNSRPSCDGRPIKSEIPHPSSGFNSRPSCDGRHEDQDGLQPFHVSIHARRATDDGSLAAFFAAALFQFTPVMRRATGAGAITFGTLSFQFTPVMRRATAFAIVIETLSEFQFTPVMRRATRLMPDISPPRGFQFTPVMRRATIAILSSSRLH